VTLVLRNSPVRGEEHARERRRLAGHRRRHHLHSRYSTCMVEEIEDFRIQDLRI
jgi:hypothetical protein